jgi:hypothetical protein
MVGGGGASNQSDKYRCDRRERGARMTDYFDPSVVQKFFLKLVG